MEPPSQPTSVSVVVPARNEEETLPRVLSELAEVVPRLPRHRVEVIVVDDHSTDDTAAVARAHGATVVSNPLGPGKGRALRSGFAAASGEVLAMMDADWSHQAAELPLLLSALTDGVGLVIGSRTMGGTDEYTPLRAVGNIVFTVAIHLVSGCRLTDALNGYKLFRREVFTDFAYTSKAFEIEIEIIANTLRRGYRVVEVASHERARAGGAVKSRIVRHGTRFLMRVLREAVRGVTPRQLKSG